MKCPFCQSDDTSVVDSREIREGSEVRRRRHCVQCQQRFTTYEKVEQAYPWVIKKDGVRQAFNLEKVKAGVLRAVEKRPVSIHHVDQLVQEVVQSLSEKNEKEVKSQSIGEEVMKRLKLLDQVAYVRFASVYREFKDIQDFVQELSTLLQKKK